ncbi:MAG TPA: CHRD domain-containing protein [Albitalea sp.]
MTSTPASARMCIAACAMVALLGGCASSLGSGPSRIALSGSHEVPPVTTDASGEALFRVERNGSIQGKVTTQGLAATAAHIHEGAAGSNGPPIVPLARTAENEWSVPPGTRLSDAQLESYRESGLYVNVHSSAYPGGEIRGQLVP